MIKCKYRTILLFLLLIIYLNEVGARRNRNTIRKEKCTKPDKVSNAGLKRRYERKEMFNDGDKVVYTCQPGYTMEGMTMQRWCRKGNWTDALFTCNQKCTKPDKVSNANLKKKYKRKRRFKDGDKVEYNCQPGYTMGGATRKRWCRKGNWTGVLFSCNSGHPYRQSTLNQDLKVYGNISTDQILAETNNKEYVGDLEFELMELDMIVDKSVNTPSSSQSFRGNINKHKSRRWPLEIHYHIGDKMSEAQENAIRKAIPVWQRYSCLSFSENKQAYDRIEFELAKDNMCWSYVGKKQGSQTISLGETCFEKEIIVHEIGHALGFYHEHNRWDRDDYIKIHYENIEPGKTQHFQKRKNTVFDTNYDYMSIMHYGQYFYSKNESANLITIETTNDTFQSKIGKAKRPSFQDYKTLNAMYKCADRCAKIKCPEVGFLGKNCQCYCKGNPNGTLVKLCSQKEECHRPDHNKYLFDILEKDKLTKVSIYRTSFPDKTVVHIHSSNWNCAPVFKLRCEDGEWKTKERSITECPVTLKIALTNKTEGVVKVTLNDYYEGYICDDDWDDNDATVACKMLGYTNGLAYFLKPQEVNKSLPFLLDNVQCSGNELSLAECKHNEWGDHNCRYTEVVTVKCSNSSLPYHIDKTECGIIQLGNSKRKKRQLKVVGGLDTIKGMHPWQVGIQWKQNGWVHRCGGTIINDKWILSAAHCFDDLETKYDGLDAKLDLKDIRVIVGDHDLTKHDEYEKIFYIEYIVKHWNYSEFERNYTINDIALLKIKSYIVFNDYIQPACLPESSDLSETICEVSGWGKEKENGSMTDTLRAAQVTISQDHDCLDFLKTYPIDFGKVICAGDGSADTCQGDSGGPLICEINGKSTVIGITSWGNGCGRKEAPGIYTNVSKYKRWINNQISYHRFEEEYADDIDNGLMELDDMIVDKSFKTPSSSESVRANFNQDETRRWPTEIHYQIGDEMSEVQWIAILEAILVWQRYSCLSFSENKQANNRIKFKLVTDNMCASSHVGMNQGLQTIYLGETCFRTEIIVHQIGHALGFYHEHNRWDRDDYIKIHYENIEPGKKQYFQKQQNAVFDTNYDYLSIMHNGQYFFSRNESAKLITIETKNDTFQSKIGKAKQPSFQDYKTLNVMFKCADLCPTIECPEAGFVGKYCKCYCKGNSDDTPVKLCNKTGECRRPTVNTYLIDVMGKDKNSTVSINRTSFPDKTVLNLVSTNWECTSNSQLRCEDGDWKEISIAECPVTLNISLTDETEGVVKVTLNGINDGYICDDDWDDNDATVACKMLGYTKGLAFFPKAKEVNESLPILLDNVQCSGEELSLADCKHNGWGNHDCDYLEVVSVKCFDDSYSNHINATTNITCGKIKLHNHNSKRKTRQVRVIGGLETEKGMHPWQVNIQRKKRGWIRNWCGGTIINKEWILSAAHCFDDFVRKYDGLNAKLDIKDIRVIVGDHDLTKHDEYEKMFEVEYIVKHWNYNDFKRIYNNNDIALLKVKSTSGIAFNDYVQPACLPEDLNLFLSETKCKVSGWGKTNSSGEISDKLKAAEVPIIPDHVCQSNYRNYSIDFEKVICAGDATADACQGDSGGPLICNINRLNTVVGITSWGEGCGQKDSPGVYTNVSAYIKWINEQISNHRLEGCKLSDDERYKYLNMNGDEIKPGDNIVVGDTLTVICRFNDVYPGYDYEYYDTVSDTTADVYSNITYDYYYYYYYDTHTNTTAGDITISCKDDHTMTKIHKECPEETKDERCLTIDNGNVQKLDGYYVVSCHKGFSIDIIEPEEKKSNCIDGILKSVFGGQEPKCVPDRCQVPYDYDTLLSISDRFHVSLSGGSVVEVGDYVYFNCSKAMEDMHEPVNRRFKCINGQWIEDERDKLWKFGNNGTFPKCRKTICEPECENGGVCLRDDECKCKHFISGKHCENVLCDDKCKANNGECVGPGKCRCPEGKFGTNCKLSSCRLPDIEDMAILNTPRTHYAIGETVSKFTCSPGHFLSSDKGMTCQNNGKWSDVITCIKGVIYLISAKTGTRPGAGTDANVYIILSGSGGSTRRINFGGEFESGDVDEIREFAKDIRPIHKVQIGHDGGDILPAWDLEYISVYVEYMEEFHVFRNNRKQWVEKDNDLTLYREGNKTCINSFDDGHLWYLDWGSANYIKFGRGGNMSLRICKQSCVNWKDKATQKPCVSVYYDHHHQECSGFTFVDRFYALNNDRLGKVYLRTC